MNEFYPPAMREEFLRDYDCFPQHFFYTSDSDEPITATNSTADIATPAVENNNLRKPSKKEIQIVQLVAAGKSNPQIANILGLPESSIIGRRHGAYAAVGAHNSAQAVVAYYAHGYLKSHGNRATALGEIEMTQEQKQIAELLLEGLSNQEISQRVDFTTVKGVEWHISEILRAAKAQTRAHAVRNIIEIGGVENIKIKEAPPDQTLTERRIAAIHLASLGYNEDESAHRMGISKGGYHDHVHAGLKVLDIPETVGDRKMYAILGLFLRQMLPPYDGTLIELQNVDLNDQEDNVLALVVQGLNNSEIVSRLGIKRHIVSAIVATLKEKLGAKNRHHLGRVALESRLVVVQPASHGRGFSLSVMSDNAVENRVLRLERKLKAGMVLMTPDVGLSPKERDILTSLSAKNSLDAAEASSVFDVAEQDILNIIKRGIAVLMGDDSKKTKASIGTAKTINYS